MFQIIFYCFKNICYKDKYKKVINGSTFMMYISYINLSQKFITIH